MKVRRRKIRSNPMSRRGTIVQQADDIGRHAVVVAVLRAIAVRVALSPTG